MRFRLERRVPKRAGTPQLVEVVTPRTNTASLTSAENLLAAIGLAEPFALEIEVSQQTRRFLIRAASPAMRRHLEGQLGAAYPQAALREVDPAADPARSGPDEQVQCGVLELRAPAYLPIRTFKDVDIDAEHAAQADPVLGLLSGVGDLPPGWRAVSQLVLQPATDDWCRGYQRRAVQHPLAGERVPRPAENAGTFFYFVVLLLGLVAVGLQALAWFRSGQWLPLGLVALVGIGLGIVAPRLIELMLRPTMYDMDLVREKVSRVAYRAELRLVVYAPASAEALEVYARLERFAAAYRHFNLAAGNGFRMRHVQSAGRELWRPVGLSPLRRRPILTTRELAGLWHLPHATADVALLERTTARRWLPLPAMVADGCRIGVARHQGREVSVAIPDDVLRRHVLLVAKTRRGKSTLMLRLARQAMLGEPRRAVLLVDPHRDLADVAIGLVPRERLNDVVYLDVSNTERPFGLNVLDVGLGWSRDRAVANALTIFQREWGDRFWGPRMEDAFRFGLLSLFEANQLRMAKGGLLGRQSQYTLLDLPALFGDTAFRHVVLSDVADPTIRHWWSDYYAALDRRFQLDVVNPILSKLHRFEGSSAARLIVSQAASTVDPTAWLRERAIVIVNTARGCVGENVAGLIGGTLVNLVALAIAEQARAAPEARARVSILVDEFHTLPGADYETIMSELNKYGASLVLATQSLSRLLTAGRDDERGLRATVFANLDGLFAFNCSAEDARYLVPELGGAVDEQDLLELGEHQCYVRLSAGGERLPTFSVSLDPPLPADPDLRSRLMAASASRFGRPVESVEAERQVAYQRIEDARRHAAAAQENSLPVRRQAERATSDQPARARNEHRGRRKRKAHQPRDRAHA